MEKILEDIGRVYQACVQKLNELASKVAEVDAIKDKNLARRGELDAVEADLATREKKVKGIENAQAMLEEGQKLVQQAQVSMAEVGSRANLWAKHEQEVTNELNKREISVAKREEAVSRKEEELENLIMEKVASVLRK